MHSGAMNMQMVYRGAVLTVHVCTYISQRQRQEIRKRGWRTTLRTASPFCHGNNWNSRSKGNLNRQSRWKWVNWGVQRGDLKLHGGAFHLRTTLSDKMFQSHVQLYSMYMDIQLDSLKQKRFCCILFRYIVFIFVAVIGLFISLDIITHFFA